MSTPLGAKTPGAGQVVSVGRMYRSMVNQLLRKWLAGTPWAGSVQVVAKGEGEVRLTSFCSRQRYAVPSCATWVVVPRAFCSPSTTRPPTRPHWP